MPNFRDDPVISNATTANTIEGVSVSGRGLVGKSDTNYGIRGHSNKIAGIRGSSDESRGVEGWATKAEGVVGVSKTGTGVLGQTETGGVGVAGASATGVGVQGRSTNGRGVEGWSDTQYGVAGESKTSAGVRGTSADGRGVEGWSTRSEGVVGISKTGNAVWGQTDGAGVGVLGTSKSGSGVLGQSNTGAGVWGVSDSFEGVHAETKSPVTAAIAAVNLNPAGTGAAVFAKKEGTQGHAGFFAGNVHVTGLLSVERDITLTNADCAEDFNIADADSVEPGTVMILGDDESLHPCCHSYDKRVAGVVSGAGGYKPGIVLDKQQSQSNRKPIALLGKVFCKVDAQYGAIQVGDLLTTSPTPGHAMKTEDPMKAFGAVIGKALRPLADGQGLIPILIALQ